MLNQQGKQTEIYNNQQNNKSTRIKNVDVLFENGVKHKRSLKGTFILPLLLSSQH